MEIEPARILEGKLDGASDLGRRQLSTLSQMLLEPLTQRSPRPG